MLLTMLAVASALASSPGQENAQSIGCFVVEAADPARRPIKSLTQK